MTAVSDRVRWFASLGSAAVLALAVAAVYDRRLALAWFAASRIAYVVFVGVSLRAAARTGPSGYGDQAEAVWRRFRGRAAWLMENDACAFGALCVVTSETLRIPGPRWLPIVVGAVLFALGAGVKLWASASLPAGNYYWRNFFVAAQEGVFSEKGPYRWMSNPMYTVGHSHCYGFAIACLSTPGLIASAVAQATMLGLDKLIERPHLRDLTAGRPT